LGIIVKQGTTLPLANILCNVWILAQFVVQQLQLYLYLEMFVCHAML